MSSCFPLIVVAGAARPLLVTRAAPPAPAGRPDWLTTVNVRSAVNRVCRRADTACVVWLTLRPGSASGQARRNANARRGGGTAPDAQVKRHAGGDAGRWTLAAVHYDQVFLLPAAGIVYVL